MKFRCDQCGTRYSIADEKVRNRILKIRCKICEHVITVRDPASAQDQQTPAPLQPVAQQPAPQQPAPQRPAPAPIPRPPVASTPAPQSAGAVVGSLGVSASLPAQPSPGFGGLEERTMVEEIPEDLLDEAPAATPQPARPPIGEMSGLIDLGQLDKLDSSPTAVSQPEMVRDTAGGFFAPQDTLPPLTPAPELPRPTKLTGEFRASELTEGLPAEMTASPLTGAARDEAEVSEEATTVQPAAASSMSFEAPRPPAPAPSASAPAAPSAPVVPMDDNADTLMAPAVDGEGGSKRGLWITLAAVAVIAILGVALGLSGGEPAAEADAAVAAAPSEDPAEDPAPSGDPAEAPDEAPAGDTAEDPAGEDPADAPEAPADEPEAPKGPTAKGPTAKGPTAKGPTAKGPTAKEPVAKRAARRSSKRPTDEDAPKAPATSSADPLKKSEARPTLPRSTEKLPVTLPREAIASTMRQRRAAITHCYSQHLKREGAPITTRTMLRFQIERSGRTNEIRLPRSLEDTSLKPCLTSLISRVRFGRFSGPPIPVEYPLLFQAPN